MFDFLLSISYVAGMADQPAKGTTRDPGFLSPVIAAAATHPTRVHAMTILSERTATPSEIGAEIGRSAQHVTYHLRRLEQLGLVEVAGKCRLHGGRVISSIYRSTQRPLFDQASWGAMSETEQAGVTTTILGLMSEDITRAVADGTVNLPTADEAGLEANHISRTPLAVDAEGWNELGAILEETLMQVLQVQERSANRSPGQSLITAKVLLLQFQSPPPPGRQ